MAGRFQTGGLLARLRRRWSGVAAMLRFASCDEGLMLRASAPEGMLFLKGKPFDVLGQAIQEMEKRQWAVFGASNVPVGTRNAATRDTWIESVLKALPEGAKLLDAGAGEMQYKKFCGHLTYVSQDLAAYDGRGNAAGLQTGRWDTTGIDIVSDICSMPVEDASFDAVLCSEVLEHLTDPLKALQELTRVLRSGGTLILTAPFCSLTHFAPYHYATGFNKYFYLHHLRELGFRDIEVVENGNYFEFMAQELRRIQPMAEKFAASSLSAEGEFAVSTLLALLQEFSEHDSGSSEMLHFDCQVIATKTN